MTPEQKKKKLEAALRRTLGSGFTTPVYYISKVEEKIQVVTPSHTVEGTAIPNGKQRKKIAFDTR